MEAKIIFTPDAEGGLDIRIEKDVEREVPAGCDKMASWCWRLAHRLGAESGETGLFEDPEGCTSPASIAFGDNGIKIDFDDGIKDGQPVSLAQQMALHILDSLMDMVGPVKRADA